MTKDVSAGDAEAVIGTYERQAGYFDATRSQALIERGWLARFAALLPEGGRVLDLGCGTGRPIAAWLAAEGFRVTGLDAAKAMIALARHHAPEGDWRVGDMRGLDLGITFDGILSWDAFFHLTREAQRALLPRIARHLAPGGALLLTVGPEDSEVIGRVGPEAVYHASLAPGDYAARLAAEGLRVVDFRAEDPDCDRHTVLLARKA